MRDSRSVTQYLEDMLEATEKALSFTAGLERDQFLENEQMILAIARLLEIIGEAAKRIPESIQLQNPDVPWKDITGTRDRLIHAYFHIKAERLWSTVENDLPLLRSSIRRILDEDQV